MKPYYDDGKGRVIYHGDCREVLRSLPAESVDVMWTDPPYGHDNQNGDLQSSRVGVRGGRQREPVSIKNDSHDEWRITLPQVLFEVRRVLRSDCCCCCCCCCGGGGPSPSFATMALWLDDWFQFFHAVVWDKSARGHGLGWRYRRDYEFVMVAHKRGGKLSWRDENIAVPNIIRTPPVPNTMHPTTKPVALVSAFLRWHTPLNGMVVDPFMGSGTTLRAAKDNDLNAIGIEIEERYCEVAADRLRQECFDFGATG